MKFMLKLERSDREMRRFYEEFKNASVDVKVRAFPSLMLMVAFSTGLAEAKARELPEFTLGFMKLQREYEIWLKTYKKL
ncbi:hypothetical protein KEJ27_09360 [Candidatus Bathyarchaeota archaeon]|nr:hypothetical protein [Candidatus Bathyarchaeota archaeon]